MTRETGLRGRVVVVTAHRRENWGDGLTGIVEGVKRLAVVTPDNFMSRLPS